MMFTSRDRRVTRFELNIVILVLSIISIDCVNPANPIYNDNGRFTFAVADVGQGLAQFGVIGGRAVLWDVGPANRYDAWRGAYGRLGDPPIDIIMISHSDEDHYGALRHFDPNINWTGALAVSPYEDTAKIRANSGAWADRVVFRSIAEGDTLIFPYPRPSSDTSSVSAANAVRIVCLWPPKDLPLSPTPDGPLDGSERNRYSLVFSVRHGHTGVLITGDIDSTAMIMIAARGGRGLRADILAAPHHGSAGSVNSLFFSYVGAETAVISCARQNGYGHPSAQMIDALTLQGTNLLYTYIDGTVRFVSNGHYFSEFSGREY